MVRTVECIGNANDRPPDLVAVFGLPTDNAGVRHGEIAERQEPRHFWSRETVSFGDLCYNLIEKAGRCSNEPRSIISPEQSDFDLLGGGPLRSENAKNPYFL